MLQHESIAQRKSDAVSLGTLQMRVPASLMRSRWFQKNACFTGLGDTVTQEGFCALRMKLAGEAAMVGAAVGLMFSTGFAAVLALAGCALGATAPKRVLARRIDWRTQQMEQHLPEMLDVVAIGMRSGLSFDRSLQIYASRFPALLAAEFERARRAWSSGLERRDDALRQLAASYDSQIFSRVIESIIRAMRFGASMAEGLEDAAREARVAYRTRRQEQIAKAPVKMMIPTGTLILPAMLIMVMGPVLLELIGGGM